MTSGGKVAAFEVHGCKKSEGVTKLVDFGLPARRSSAQVQLLHESVSQRRQALVALDAPEAWLDIESRGSKPPLSLHGILPEVNLAAEVLDH